MNQRNKIIDYLDQLLEPNKYDDYCPNGLQVEGKSNVGKIVTGVTGCLALLEKAVEAKADMVLVHHGYFWKNEISTITGIKKNRIKLLLAHDINFVAYHLPLDAHSELGNNVQLANRLDFKIAPSQETKEQFSLVLSGELKKPMTINEFALHIERELERKPLVEAADNKVFKKIAWCTGGAQNYIDEAIMQGCEAYLTGELSEQTVHIARENNIHLIGAGHHATERYGIKALGEHLAKVFNLEHQFIDIANPV